MSINGSVAGESTSSGGASVSAGSSSVSRSGGPRASLSSSGSSAEVTPHHRPQLRTRAQKNLQSTESLSTVGDNSKFDLLVSAMHQDSISSSHWTISSGLTMENSISGWISANDSQMIEEQPVVPLTTSNLQTVTKLQAPHKSQYNMGELLRVSELQTIMEGAESSKSFTHGSSNGSQDGSHTNSHPRAQLLQMNAQHKVKQSQYSTPREYMTALREEVLVTGAAVAKGTEDANSSHPKNQLLQMREKNKKRQAQFASPHDYQMVLTAEQQENIRQEAQLKAEREHHLEMQRRQSEESADISHQHEQRELHKQKTLRYLKSSGSMSVPEPTCSTPHALNDLRGVMTSTTSNFSASSVMYDNIDLSQCNNGDNNGGDDNQSVVMSVDGDSLSPFPSGIDFLNTPYVSAAKKQVHIAEEEAEEPVHTQSAQQGHAQDYSQDFQHHELDTIYETNKQQAEDHKAQQKPVSKVNIFSSGLFDRNDSGMSSDTKSSRSHSSGLLSVPSSNSTGMLSTTVSGVMDSSGGGGGGVVAANGARPIAGPLGTL
eukprot:gene37359-46096_t